MLKLIFIGIFICSINIAFAQQDSRVDNIINKVNEINKDTSTYLTKTLDEEQFLDNKTSGGGTLTGYFRNRELVKIRKQIGAGFCTETENYYLSDDEVIFVYGQEKTVEYMTDNDGTLKPVNQTITMEFRYYFSNNQLVKTDFKGMSQCRPHPKRGDADNLINQCADYYRLLLKK